MSPVSVGSAVLLCGLATASAVGQTEGTVAGCIPVSERGGAGREYGCFIVATQAIGHLDSGRAFWHVSGFPTRAAAEAARGAQGTVVEALGRVWLFTIGAAGRPPGRTEVAEIGPLPVTRGVTYTAQYMEAVFRPGMKSIIHRHAGPEAWYTLSGETCLETPAGIMVGRAGGRPTIVPPGPPMELTATGTEVRRALVLVLHDATQPASTPATDWRPKGLCNRRTP
jgi:hypothetical protein